MVVKRVYSGVLVVMLFWVVVVFLAENGLLIFQSGVEGGRLVSGVEAQITV